MTTRQQLERIRAVCLACISTGDYAKLTTAALNSTLETINVIINRGAMPLPQSDMGIIAQKIIAAWEGVV